MFKLTIAFDTIAHLSAFVSKMGSDVQEAVIEHSQPLNSATTAAAPAAKKRTSSKATTPAAPAAPNVPTQEAPAAPFPGGFAPGNTGTPAPAQPLHNVAPAASASAPVVAPMAQAPAAPAAPAAPVPVSEERKKFNDGCAQLITYLQQAGTQRGYTPEQMGGVISAAMQEAGVLGRKITEISDAEIHVLYPILYKHVMAAVPQQA